jgi:decaprenylphospho-beta-D-erythro-pentofuranosid-2-ulose 2-reductase
MKHVAIFGATSSVARALAAEFAREGYGLVLAGRDPYEVRAVAADLRLRTGVPTQAVPFEALEFESHARSWEEVRAAAGDELAGVVICFGYLSGQAEAQKDPAEARRILDTNFTAAVSVLNLAANYFEARGSGFLCALSSVAGDRGRQSNYLYGAAKGGLSTYLEGLRNRLYRSGVAVITIKPGFLDTRMTYGRAGMVLVASPEQAAKSILAAIRKRKSVAYVPAFWRVIMFVIRAIPETIFKRMRL